MASILDTQRNRQGIQSLNNTLHDLNYAPGRTALLKHSNGRIYRVWAQNYFTGAVWERRLYLAYSTDEGYTWSSSVQLTSANWYDEPALLQIDNSDTSDIGVVCSKATQYNSSADNANYGYLTRFTIDTSGTLTSPIDPVTGPIPRPKHICAHRLTDRFLVSYTSGNELNNNLYIVEQTFTPGNDHLGFTNNAWVGRSYSSLTADGSKGLYAVRTRQLSNGHFAVIFTMRTAVNGETYLGRGTHRYDLAIRFSSDLMNTFGPVQQLTSYSQTLGFTLSDINVAMSADLAQLSSGSLAIAFAEASAPQCLSDDTTPALPANFYYIQHVAYHPVHNLMIMGASTFGTTGLAVVNLTSGVVTHLTASSTPRLWTTNIQRIAISADSRYIAVAQNGALDVFDTSGGASPGSWTVQSFRNSTLSGVKNNNIGWCAFDGNTKLYFSYASSSGSAGVWGGMIDMAAPTSVMNLQGTGIYNLAQDAQPIIQSDKIVAPYSTKLIATDKLTGSSLYVSTTNNSSALAYDPINDEYISGASSGGAIRRIKDRGTYFESVELIATPSVPGHFSLVTDKGAYWPVSGYASVMAPLWYSFAAQKCIGPVSTGSVEYAYNQTFFAFSHFAMIKNKTWYIGTVTDSSFGSTNYVVAMPFDNAGRLRWGIFTYNPSTLQIDTNSDNFYDMVNQQKLAALGGKSIYDFTMIVGPTEDRLILSGRQRHFGQNWLYNSFVAVVEPDAKKLTIMTRIRSGQQQMITMKTRMQRQTTATIRARARVAFAHCLKAQVRVVPYVTKTIRSRVAIQSNKQSVIPVLFDVMGNFQKRSLTLLFNVSTGYNRVQSTQARCRIAPVNTTSITGHFLVKVVPGGRLTWSSMSTKTMFVGMRVNIQK